MDCSSVECNQRNDERGLRGLAEAGSAMTDQAIQQQILKEVREMRASLSAHATDTAQRLTTLDTQMSTLVAPVPAKPKPRPVLVKASKRRQS